MRGTRVLLLFMSKGIDQEPQWFQDLKATSDHNMSLFHFTDIVKYARFGYTALYHHG